MQEIRVVPQRPSLIIDDQVFSHDIYALGVQAAHNLVGHYSVIKGFAPFVKFEALDWGPLKLPAHELWDPLIWTHILDVGPSPQNLECFAV